jgi:L-alanine-DL-glutamate epimerase-like enolase superfamily enzyme
MKITDLSITLHNWDVPPVNYTGTTAGGVKEVGVVTIATDEGVEGHSFLGTSNRGADEFLHEVIGRLKPLLIGRNPLDIGAIWNDLWARNRVASTYSICAVDVALWDIAGKVANLPLHRLFGTYRDKAPAYASSAVLDSPEAYAEEALRFREQGWTAYKIHPPRFWKRDIEVCEAVKKAVGDTMVLMLDSTWCYGYEEALRVGLAIQEMGYYWCAPLRRSA